MSWIEILPNLGVGVASVLGMVAIVYFFMVHLKEERESRKIDLRVAQEERTKKNEEMRAIEKEIRDILTHQVAENTRVMHETNQAIARVVDHLNKDK